jgi:hypothetical protein
MHGMWVQFENVDVVLFSKVVFFRIAETIGAAPVNVAPQSHFKHVNGAGGDGINHLLMEARIPFRGIKSMIGKQQTILKIDRRVIALAGRVIIDHRDLFPGRARFERLPGDLHDDLVTRVSVSARARIDRVNLQRPSVWRRHTQSQPLRILFRRIVFSSSHFANS